MAGNFRFQIGLIELRPGYFLKSIQSRYAGSFETNLARALLGTHVVLNRKIGNLNKPTAMNFGQLIGKLYNVLIFRLRFSKTTEMDLALMRRSQDADDLSIAEPSCC